MKKITLVFAFMLAVAGAVAQSMYVHKTDGNVYEFKVSDVDSINFAASTTDDFHYTVTYMPNGGEGKAVVDTVLYGFPYAFRPVDLFEKEGYHSFEWNLKADGTGRYYLSTDTLPMLTRNIVVYPKWYATAGELDTDGYEYIDLGLTSGTKWATWDYGATAVGKIGSYVIGGDQDSKSKRPTQAQAQELIDECDWLLRSDAYIVKSKINNNVLILPLSGYQSQKVVSGRLSWVTGGKGLWGHYWTKDSFSSQGFTYFYALDLNFSVRKLSSATDYKYNVRYVKK
jgi:hypothetical protein